MKNITAKIRKHYPVSDKALQAMLEKMSVAHCPKNTMLVRAGNIDRNVYFIEEGVTRSIFHKDGTDTTTWFSMEGVMFLLMLRVWRERTTASLTFL